MYLLIETEFLSYQRLFSSLSAAIALFYLYFTFHAPVLSTCFVNHRQPSVFV